MTVRLSNCSQEYIDQIKEHPQTHLFQMNPFLQKKILFLLKFSKGLKEHDNKIAQLKKSQQPKYLDLRNIFPRKIMHQKKSTSFITFFFLDLLVLVLLDSLEAVPCKIPSTNHKSMI